MSFFVRSALSVAIVVGVVHVFRRDITRIARVLKKPTENFINDVKKEISSTKSTGSIAGSLPSSTEGAASQAANVKAAIDAAQQVKSGEAPKAPEDSGASEPQRQDQVEQKAEDKPMK